MRQVEQTENRVSESGLRRPSLLVVPIDRAVESPFKVFRITDHSRFHLHAVEDPQVQARKIPRLKGELTEDKLIEYLKEKRDITGEKLTGIQSSLTRREQMLNDAQTILVETLQDVSSLKVNGFDIFSRLRTQKNGQVLSNEVMAEKRAKRLRKELKLLQGQQFDLYVADSEKRTLLQSSLGVITPKDKKVLLQKERRQVKRLEHQVEKTQNQIDFLENKEQRGKTKIRLRQLYLMLGSVQTEEQRIKILGEVAEIRAKLPTALVRSAQDSSWTPKDWVTKSLLRATQDTNSVLQAITRRSEKVLERQPEAITVENKRPLVVRVRGFLSSLKCNPFEKGISVDVSIQRLAEWTAVAAGATQVLLSIAGSPVQATEKPAQVTAVQAEVALPLPPRLESRRLEVSGPWLMEARSIQEEARREIESRDSEARRPKPALPAYESLVAGRYTENFPLASVENGRVVVQETPGVEAPEQRERRLAQETKAKEAKRKEAERKPDPIVPTVGGKAPCANGEYIAKYFRPEHWRGVCLVQQEESGGRRDAVGDRYLINGIYAPSCGPMQIRTLPGRPSCALLKTDMDLHFKKAREILDLQGWGAWRRAAAKHGLL